MRFALVGCGVIAPTHVRALQALSGGVELVSCSDVVPQRADALARGFSLEPRAFADVLADPDIDAVTVCTPSGLHAEVGVPALLAGKHVMVEKPMEISVEGCDRLLAAQRESGRRSGSSASTASTTPPSWSQRSVNNGELGGIILADCRVPWYRTQEYYDSGDWRGTWEFDGGGCLINQGVHTIDLLRWICGPATSVYARARTAAHEGTEVEDVVCATVEFAGGAVGSVLASTAAYPGFPARLAVHGTTGSAVIEGDRLAMLARMGREPLGGEVPNAHALQVATGGTRAVTTAVAEVLESSDPADVWGEAHRRQFLDFVDAVEGGRSPLVDGAEGRNAVELVQAIYRAAGTGEVVSL